MTQPNKDAVADIHVAVSMNLPGPYPMYTCDQFDPNPSPDCTVTCKVPTNIIFTLDPAICRSRLAFCGYSPNSSSPMPLTPIWDFLPPTPIFR